MGDKIELDFTMLQKILVQLINSDGMEVKNNYLIQQKIYWIDNVSIIEDLEKIIMEHYYNKILSNKGKVSKEEIFNIYSPQYINYDKFFEELEGKSSKEKTDNDLNNTLNKYL